MWASFGDRIYDLGAGAGVVDFNGAVTSWGSAMFIEALGTAILLFAILGIVDTRSPEGWAGLVIGLVVVAIIITVGPVTNASINPARGIGPLLISDLNGGFHNWTEQLFAYIPANLIGATVGVFAYDAIATPQEGLAADQGSRDRARPRRLVRAGADPLGGECERHRAADSQEVPQQPGGHRPRVARRPGRGASRPRPRRPREPGRRSARTLR